MAIPPQPAESRAATDGPTSLAVAQRSGASGLDLRRCFKAIDRLNGTFIPESDSGADFFTFGGAAVAFVFTSFAGMLAGLTVDLFFLCLLLVPLFMLAALAGVKLGLLVGLTSAAEMVALMQAGYMAGLMLRGAVSLSDRAHGGRSRKAGEL